MFRQDNQRRRKVTLDDVKARLIVGVHGLFLIDFGVKPLPYFLGNSRSVNLDGGHVAAGF